jgi:hypothetical protein
MPDVLSYFNERKSSALETKGKSADPSSNFLPTTLILSPDDLIDLKDKDRVMSFLYKTY